MGKFDVAGFNSRLKNKKLTIVCAESATAGLLASTIASVSGASDVLIGSIVTYNRNLKTAVLGVHPKLIDTHTAESNETTEEMAYGLTKIYPAADIFVAVTGVASLPVNDYVITKELGQVYVAVYYKNIMYAYETIIRVEGNDRNDIRYQMVEYILKNILEIIDQGA